MEVCRMDENVEKDGKVLNIEEKNLRFTEYENPLRDRINHHMATPSNLYGLLGAVNTKDKWGHADKPTEASMALSGRLGRNAKHVTHSCQTYVSEGSKICVIRIGVS